MMIKPKTMQSNHVISGGDEYGIIPPWMVLEPSQKLSLQQTIFPDGIRYADGFIGTAKNSLFFSVLHNNQHADAKMASPRGFEPLLPP